SVFASTLAGGSLRRRNSAMQVTDLPEPDSPTMPRLSPGSSAKLTPRTACTSPSCWEKLTWRSSISTRGIGIPWIENRRTPERPPAHHLLLGDVGVEVAGETIERRKALRIRLDARSLHLVADGSDGHR